MNFLKQASNSARDAAIKMAKQIGHEPAEILKGAKEQVVGGAENKVQNQGPSMMQEVMTGDGKFVPPTANEEQSIHAAAKNRLAQIEAELRQLRMQREQKSQDWAKEQDKVMGVGQEQPRQEIVAPPSRKAHGPQGPGAKKSSGNSMETSRQKKG